MKKIFTILSVIALSIFASSCVHKGDLNLEPVPEIDFTFECVEGANYNFTNITEGATNVSWSALSFASGSSQEVGSGSGDTWNFTFPGKGIFWVKMSATYKGIQQTIYYTVNISKSSVISLTDGTVDDWAGVTDPDFMLTAELSGYSVENRCSGKFDYDANNLYFFFALNSDLPGAGPGEAIINIRLDADDKKDTGMSTKKVGAEWYLEGALWGNEGWYTMYDSSSGDTVESDMVVNVGTCVEVGDMMYIEFGLDRAKYGVKGLSTSCFIKFYNEDWNDAIYIYGPDGKTPIHFALNK